MTTKHNATVTHLEMRARPKNHCPHPMGHIALMRAAEPPVHFYRYLYHVVGKDYIWVHRKQMPDDALRAIIEDERVEIYVLYADGCPAGFCELDFRNMPRAELSFLGVVPEFMGRGFGRFLLCEAIRMAWDKEPELLALQTCSLDHPRALPLYQRHGFVPYAQEKVVLVDDGTGPGF